MAEKSAAVPMREQNLALRVMRLSRPRFNETIPFACDPADAYSMGIANCMLNTGQESPNSPLGSYLVAPHTMRDVYVGEAFTFYISIINTSVHVCKDIAIKADIQTQTQRITISEMVFSGISLDPNQQVGRVFTHEVQEIGEHILVCALSYTGANEEKLSLRKFFKFPVSKPIELVKQNFYGLENCDTYFEAQLHNLCSNPIFIDSVSLSPATSFECTEITSSPLGSNSLGPQSIRQFLFRFSPKDKLAENWKNIVDYGKLRVTWRTIMGDVGRMDLETAQRMVHGYGNLRLLSENVPRRARLNQLFTAIFRVQNCSDRPMELRLTFDQSQQTSLIHSSVSGQRMQTLQPNHSTEIALDLLPFVPGLQQISGIRITDLQQKRTYEFDDITQVFIY